MAGPFYIDPVSGDDANAGTLVAPWKTIWNGATPARVAIGEEVRIKKTPDPTSIGSCTWTVGSTNVTIPSGVIKDVDMCETAWTSADANVTCTASTTKKQGTNSASMAFAAGFTTGIAAYKALAGATDFSGYEQLSFFIRPNADIAPNTLKLSLCSDAAGATPVDDFTIPYTLKANSWHPITVDKGAALGNSIQSVALYALLDPGTVTVLIDNVIACKASSSADSLTLNSLFGKNTATEPWWFPIAALTGTTLTMDARINSTGSRTYYGTSESVTTYKVQPYLIEYNPGSATYGSFTPQRGGDSTNGIFTKYIGGWNFSTDERDGHTWVDGLNVVLQGCNLDATTSGWVEMGYVGYVRWTGGFTAYNITGKFYNGFVVGCDGTPLWNGSPYSSYVDMVATNNRFGIALFARGNYYKNIKIYGAVDTAQGQWHNLGSGNIFEGDNWSINGAGFALYTTNYNSVSSVGNTVKGFKTGGNGGALRIVYGPNYFENLQVIEATEFQFDLTDVQYGVHSHNHDAVAGNHMIAAGAGYIYADTTNRRTASGFCWKFSPTSLLVGGDIKSRLLKKPIAHIACTAGSLVTVSVWAKRDDTGITGRIWVDGAQDGGPATEQSASTSGAAGSYEKLTISWTPTSDGVVEVMFGAYGGTTYNVYIDDMEIEQA